MFRKSAKRTAAGIMSLAMILGAAGMFPAKNAAAAGAVTINEVCPKNTTYALQNGDGYDWVELYNGSGSAVDISGWGFSDKEDTPYRFTFPSGTVLQAGERMVFFCDGTAGETNSSIAPFGLSTSGETLTLTDTSGNIASQVTFTDMAKDTSYGQYPDGSGEYYVLGCTPGAANSAPEGSNAVRTPSFSAESGFYNSGFSLTLDVYHRRKRSYDFFREIHRPHKRKGHDQRAQQAQRKDRYHRIQRYPCSRRGRAEGSCSPCGSCGFSGKNERRYHKDILHRLHKRR